MPFPFYAAWQQRVTDIGGGATYRNTAESMSETDHPVENGFDGPIGNAVTLGVPCRAAAQFNQGAAANRRPAGHSDGSDNLAAIVAADRAFPAAVSELGR
jgi:hypothetical protein